MTQDTQDSPPVAPVGQETAVQRTRFALARPGVQVLVISGLFVVTLLYFGGKAVLDGLLGNPVNQSDVAFGALVGGMMIWRALGAVRGYVVQTGGPHGPELVIQRVAPWATVIVSLARLRRADAEPGVRGILNTSMLSMGGLFGWSGPAVVPDLGPIQVFANNRERAVLLELAPRTEKRFQTSDGTEPKGVAVLVSPRDPQAF